MVGRTTGVAKGDNQQQRYTGTLVRKFANNLGAYQPLNSNLTSISAIPTNISGVITVVNGVYHGSTLALTGDVTGSISTTSTALTLATVNSNVGTFQGLTINGKGLVTAATNQNYLTANQSITVSGDGSGSGTTAITLTLATVNSTPGTYNWGTVNAKGLVTAAQNVAISIITASTNTFPYTETAIVGIKVVTVDATAGSAQVFLPKASTCNGVMLTYKKIDSGVNTVTVQAWIGDNIDSSNTYALLTQYNSVTICCDGTTWNITGKV